MIAGPTDDLYTRGGRVIGNLKEPTKIYKIYWLTLCRYVI